MLVPFIFGSMNTKVLTSDTKLKHRHFVSLTKPPGPHQVKNVGETDVVLVFVEVTGKYTATPEGLKCPCDTDPNCYK